MDGGKSEESVRSYNNSTVYIKNVSHFYILSIINRIILIMKNIALCMPYSLYGAIALDVESDVITILRL